MACLLLLHMCYIVLYFAGMSDILNVLSVSSGDASSSGRSRPSDSVFSMDSAPSFSTMSNDRSGGAGRSTHTNTPFIRSKGTNDIASISADIRYSLLSLHFHDFASPSDDSVRGNKVFREVASKLLGNSAEGVGLDRFLGKVVSHSDVEGEDLPPEALFFIEGSNSDDVGLRDSIFSVIKPELARFGRLLESVEDIVNSMPVSSYEISLGRLEFSDIKNPALSSDSKEVALVSSMTDGLPDNNLWQRDNFLTSPSKVTLTYLLAHKNNTN